MSQRYLRKVGTKRVVAYTELLARRTDMYECDVKGKTVDAHNPKSRPDLDRGEDEVVITKLPKAPVNEKFRLAPDEKLTPAQAKKQAAEKDKLITFAKDRYNVTLDPADSLTIIKKRVDTLNKKAAAEPSTG